jgi:protein-tyrosine phosphatase
MVCTGNICRSPAAERVARQHFDEAGLSHVLVDSAGTGDWHQGQLAHEHTRTIGQSRGLPVTHRARAVTREDFSTFDLFVVMDKSHARWIHVKTTIESGTDYGSSL